MRIYHTCGVYVIKISHTLKKLCTYHTWTLETIENILERERESEHSGKQNWTHFGKQNWRLFYQKYSGERERANILANKTGRILANKTGGTSTSYYHLENERANIILGSPPLVIPISHISKLIRPIHVPLIPKNSCCNNTQLKYQVVTSHTSQTSTFPETHLSFTSCLITHIETYHANIPPNSLSSLVLITQA